MNLTQRIELYNPNINSVDLSNWIFKDSEDDHRFIFQDQNIATNGYLILCEDSSAFRILYPNIKNIVGDFDFGLNNSGETLRLFDSFGKIVDSLTYKDNSPWPVEADGDGYTLQLINYEFDNSETDNWQASLLYGTPGDANILVNSEEVKEKLRDAGKAAQDFGNSVANYFKDDKNR